MPNECARYTKANLGVSASRSARIWLYTNLPTLPLVHRWRATNWSFIHVGDGVKPVDSFIAHRDEF
eukprot:262640-Pleurochrysis_carterae.AAC.3